MIFFTVIFAISTSSDILVEYGLLILLSKEKSLSQTASLAAIYDNRSRNSARPINSFLCLKIFQMASSEQSLLEGMFNS